MFGPRMILQGDFCTCSLKIYFSKIAEVFFTTLFHYPKQDLGKSQTNKKKRVLRRSRGELWRGGRGQQPSQIVELLLGISERRHGRRPTLVDWQLRKSAQLVKCSRGAACRYKG